MIDDRQVIVGRYDDQPDDGSNSVVEEALASVRELDAVKEQELEVPSVLRGLSQDALSVGLLRAE